MLKEKETRKGWKERERGENPRIQLYRKGGKKQRKKKKKNVKLKLVLALAINLSDIKMPVPNLYTDC